MPRVSGTQKNDTTAIIKSNNSKYTEFVELFCGLLELRVVDGIFWSVLEWRGAVYLQVVFALNKRQPYRIGVNDWRGKQFCGNFCGKENLLNPFFGVI